MSYKLTLPAIALALCCGAALAGNVGETTGQIILGPNLLTACGGTGNIKVNAGEYRVSVSTDGNNCALPNTVNQASSLTPQVDFYSYSAGGDGASKCTSSGGSNNNCNVYAIKIPVQGCGMVHNVMIVNNTVASYTTCISPTAGSGQACYGSVDTTDGGKTFTWTNWGVVDCSVSTY